MDQRHRIPVFNPNAEAHAMQSLNAVMVIFQTALRPIGPEELVDLQHSLARVVDCLFPIEGNSADFAGSAPLPGGHYVHPIKTAEAAILLGRGTGMPRSRLITLATAAALMNVGYVQLKQSLIDEPRNLMDGEWEQQMHAHPAHSVAALTASGLSQETIVAIGQHHERWDGSGYPHGARGNDIVIEARILAIADTFIALRSQRPHRPAMPAEQALSIVRDGAGDLFEPGLAGAFADLVHTYAEKEERTITGGSASASQMNDPLAAAPRDEQAIPSREEGPAPPRESEAPHDGGVRTGRRPVPQQIAARAVPAAVSMGGAMTNASRMDAASRIEPARRQPPPRRRGPYHRRSLFGTDVYVRGVLGRWLD